MLVCAAGDCHGQLELMYAMIAQMEAQVGRQVDLVLQVGDLGVWPDPARVDQATRRHGDAGDYPAWHAAGQGPPIPTLFIAGNHEDFHALHGQPVGALLPNLTFLPWGRSTVFEARGQRLGIGGVGGCYSEKSYRMAALPLARRKHYTHHELQALVQKRDAHLDVLMFHDAPAGTLERLSAERPGIERHGAERTGTERTGPERTGPERTGPERTGADRTGAERPWRRESTAEGLAEVIAALRPRLCLSGHWHVRTERRIAGVRTVGLAIVPAPGCLILMDIPDDGGEPVDLLEWGGKPDGRALPQLAAPMTPPLDLEPLKALLTAWAERTLAGRALDRDTRKKIYDALADDPLRPAYMSALTGSQADAALERCVAPEAAKALHDRWAAGLWPSLPALRAR